MDKKVFKSITRPVTRYVYYLFSWSVSVLPLSFIFAMTDTLIVIALPFLGRLRRHAKESLTIAFGTAKSNEEIGQILRACFFNFGRSAVELFCYMHRPQLITERVHLTPGSRENLDNALKEGKGVMGVSAHFGNFPLMLIYLSHSGYPVNAIIRPNRDAGMERSFKELQAKMKFKAIDSLPREACVKATFKALRAKEVVVILMDQNTDNKSGVFVDFFGHKAGTSGGAVIFAMRTGAPILPIFTVRDGNGRHKVIIEPHFYPEQKASNEETIAHNVQKVTAIIEKYVRQYPVEWAWMNRRWRSKPSKDLILNIPGPNDVTLLFLVFLNSLCI